MKKAVYDLISRNLRHVNIDNQSRMIVANRVIFSSTNLRIISTKKKTKKTTAPRLSVEVRNGDQLMRHCEEFVNLTTRKVKEIKGSIKRLHYTAVLAEGN